MKPTNHHPLLLYCSTEPGCSAQAPLKTKRFQLVVSRLWSMKVSNPQRKRRDSTPKGDIAWDFLKKSRRKRNTYLVRPGKSTEVRKALVIWLWVKTFLGMRRPLYWAVSSKRLLVFNPKSSKRRRKSRLQALTFCSSKEISLVLKETTPLKGQNRGK